MKRALLLMLLLGACSDSKPRSPYPPLLGTRSEAMVRRFESSCDERFAVVDPKNEFEPDHPFARLETKRSELTEELKCEMSSSTEYGIAIAAGDVVNVYIEAPTEADRLEIFDRVFAAILPADVREPIRRSITEPRHFEFTAANAHIDAEQRGNHSIAWTVRPGGKRPSPPPR